MHTSPPPIPAASQPWPQHPWSNASTLMILQAAAAKASRWKDGSVILPAFLRVGIFPESMGAGALGIEEAMYNLVTGSGLGVWAGGRGVLGGVMVLCT